MIVDFGFMSRMFMLMRAMVAGVLMVVHVDIPGMLMGMGVFVHMFMHMGMGMLMRMNQIPMPMLMGMHMRVLMSM